MALAAPSRRFDNLQQISHVPRRVGASVQERIDALKIGQKMQDLPEHLWHDSFRFYVKEDPTRCGGPNLRMLRLDPAKPSLTVTAFIYNKFVHPFEDRFITPREAARLQDFSDSFLFSGNLTSVQRQVGNAVPAKLALGVARAIAEHAASTNSLSRYLRRSCEVPCLSLFSGVGGMDRGFNLLLQRELGWGFASVLHVENDPDCCSTLSRNLKRMCQPTDITAVASPRQYLRDQTGLDHVPIIIGGPPCQSFSQAGRQRGENDDRGRLVFEYLRFVEELRPTYFAMENVSNLRGVGGGALFEAVLQKMHELGYEAQAWKLCAADFGTAQLRWRWFFVGVLAPSRLPLLPPKPTHCRMDRAASSGLLPHTTVGEAFAGLPSLV